MKKVYLFIAIAALTITSSCGINESNQSITVNVDEKGYAFNAEYPQHKTNRVVTYIEKSLKQDEFFESTEGIKEENVTLSDSSKFHITSKPGYLKISFDQRNNSKISYQKLVKLCMGIKEVVK